MYMKKTTFISAVVLTAFILSGCGLGTTSTSAGASAQGSATSAGADILGAILSGTGGDAASSVLSGVIGVLTGSNKSASVVGTWVYEEPSVEFESENLLAQAGGVVAAKEVVSKVKPYYEKLGVTAGKVQITFKEDKTCVVNLNGRTQTANYEYDPKAHTMKITGQNLGLSIGTAYCTVSSTQMSLTFDSTKLLTLTQTIGAATGNTTLGSISQVATAFKGMKTGFKFKKQ